jgi:3',5'-cyclic AMP phosphodiesterase CpdA
MARSLKPLRALFISDIHMSNQLPQAVLAENGDTDRLQDQSALWRRVRQSVLDWEVDIVFILGDLFDKSLVDAVTLAVTVESVVALPTTTYVLPGNHDAVSTDGGRFTVEAFGLMGRDHIKYLGRAANNEAVVWDDWLRFYPIEYCASKDAYERLDAILAERDLLPDAGVSVLLMHHSVMGCKHGGWVCDDGLESEEITKHFEHVFSGHFHDTQEFGHNGMYLGAPMHHHLGDEGRPAGYWVVDFLPDGTLEKYFIDGECPRFHSTTWERAAMASPAHPGDYLRLYVDATHAEWVALRPTVAAYVDVLKGEGIKATYKHRPIYHHAERIASIGSKTAMTMDMTAAAYVDSSSVDTIGLDADRLKEIAKKALEEGKRR